MNSCNIEQLIERAVTTGNPVTVSDTFGVTDPISEASIIDVTPIKSTLSLPQSISHSGLCDALHNFGQTYAPDKSDRYATNSWKVPSAQLKISSEVKQLLQKCDSNNLPSDLFLPKNAGIYKALVEDEFSKQSEYECSQLFKKLAGGYCRIILNRDGRISWNGVKHNSIISIVSAILDREPLVAAIVVGNLLGVTPEFCFRTFPVRGECLSVVPMPYTAVQEYIPKRLTVEHQVYHLQDIEYLKDFRGSREQAICHYVDIANPLDNFFLIAGRVEINGKFALKIGATAVPARLYSRVMMAQHGSATVLLIHDMRIAKEFRAIAQESRLLDHTNIIVSGCYGGASALPALNLKDTAGHPAVILPEPTAEGLTGVIEWAKRLTKAGATSVSVYPRPITVDACLPLLSTISASWERNLWEQVVCLDDIELPSKFARDVCANSIPMSDYPKWLKSIGLITNSTDDVRELNEHNLFLSINDLPDELDQPNIPTWDDLIKPRYTTFIYGASNAGKGWVAIEITLALVTGTGAFGLFAVSRRTVCYMDGEVGGEDFKKRCRQLLKGRAEAQELIGKNLLVMPPSSDINILDDVCAKEIILKLIEAKASVLVIDNIFSLAPSAVNGSVNKLFSFIHKAEQAGIAVIVIHHSSKDGTTYKGPSELTSLSQNVFRLEGREQLVEMGDLSPEVEAACNAGGPVSRMTVEKCKAAPLVEQKSATYHLPVNGVWRWLEGSLIPTPSTLPEDGRDELEVEDVADAVGSRSEMDDLSPDEEKVFMALLGHKYARADLEKLTGLKPDKLVRILRKLTEHGRVKKEGTGKATYYRGM